MEYKFTFEDGSEALAHHGIKGMKWGVWNEETKSRYGMSIKNPSKVKANLKFAAKSAGLAAGVGAATIGSAAAGGMLFGLPRTSARAGLILSSAPAAVAFNKAKDKRAIEIDLATKAKGKRAVKDKVGSKTESKSDIKEGSDKAQQRKEIAKKVAVGAALTVGIGAAAVFGGSQGVRAVSSVMGKPTADEMRKAIGNLSFMMNTSRYGGVQAVSDYQLEQGYRNSKRNQQAAEAIRQEFQRRYEQYN